MSRAKGGLGLVVAVALLALVLAGSSEAARGGKSTYIVVLDDSVASVPAVAQEHARRFGGDLQFVYTHALKGYAVSLPDGAAAAIARLPFVQSVEPDSTYTADATESPSRGASTGSTSATGRSPTRTRSPTPARASRRTSSTRASASRTRKSAAAP